MKTHGVCISLALLMSPLWAQPVLAGLLEQTNLKVLDVTFEPIGQGKNVVRITVRNLTVKEQTFAVHIQTKSPRYGRSGIGWETQFFRTIKPQQETTSRFVFKIQGPLTTDTLIRLRFYNPQSPESFDFDEFFEERKYTGSELAHRESVTGPRLPDTDVRAKQVREAFAGFQQLVQREQYRRAWDTFTPDCQVAEFQGKFKTFADAMTGVLPTTLYFWNKATFLSMRPVSVRQSGEALTLAVAHDEETWEIDFLPSSGKWQVDWIGGYDPAIAKLPRSDDWETRLVSKTLKRGTEHFDIHYFKGSTAEKEIDSLAKTRERGHAAICDFLGRESDVRIRLILFEDEKQKFLETGHQGMGLAFGSTIVEVFNETEQLDPYHETAHILMGPYGDPPAMFNEGFAVYMSERLGAAALDHLGGGTDLLYGRARELKQKNEWIPLDELMTYCEIGSDATRPHISYAEAGAFVKFLIEQFGRDNFLLAYAALKCKDDPQVHEDNRIQLQQIYGRSVRTLEGAWEKDIAARG